MIKFIFLLTITLKVDLLNNKINCAISLITNELYLLHNNPLAKPYTIKNVVPTPGNGVKSPQLTLPSVGSLGSVACS